MDNTTRGDESTGRDPLANNLEKNSTIPNDLPDSPEDREKLEDGETVIDLPDVKDIPGQEFVNAPPLGGLADTTISSADEEGADIFDNPLDDTGTDFNVTDREKHTLERIDALPTTDERNLQRASMDNTDFQGEPLNEKGFGETLGGTVSDEDLDIPDENDETETTALGEGDEENKSYSLGSADNDNVTEGTP